MIVDVARVEAFLTVRFGGDGGDIAPLGAGVWSQAFAFRRVGRDYVLRVGAHQEDFAKDRLAAHYACPALPIPHIGLAGQAYMAYAGNWTDLQATARRTLDVAT